MASMVAPSTAYSPTTTGRSGDTIIADVQNSATQRKKTAGLGDKSRGRRRIRAPDDVNGTSDNDSDAGDVGGGEDGHSSGQDGRSRKRRRSRKGLDKKFECPQENCGKSYSRAEHL
jgi:hypothetical protein